MLSLSTLATDGPVRASTRPGPWFGTLKARLLAASALVIAASVALTATVVVHRMAQRSEQAVMDLERDNVERMASLLGQRVVGMQKMLRASASHVPAAATRDAAAAAALLDSSPALTASFAGVAVIARDGRMLAGHDGNVSDHPVLDLSQRGYFRATVAQGVPQVSPPFAGRVVREPIIQLTMPVFEDQPQHHAAGVVGVIAATLRLSSRNLLDDLTYAGLTGGDGIVTVITDASGTIISHPLRDRVMRAVETEPGLTEAVARWVEQGRPMEPSGFTLHEHGKFVSMAGVPGADWLVFRMAPDDALLGGLLQARREVVLWAVGVALLGGLLILGLLAVLLGPLQRLRSRALALQDTDMPIAAGWPAASGEIGELSRVLQQVLRERAAGEQVTQVLLQQMGSVLKAAPIGIAFTRDRRFELVGAEFSALLGRDHNELKGRSTREVFTSEDDYLMAADRVQADFWAGRPHVAEMLFRRRDGTSFWGRLKGSPVDAGQPGAGIIWLLEDVTERRAVRERLSWSASHDTLTRLLNRPALEERLQAWLQGAAASAAAGPAPQHNAATATEAATACLLCIDLDHFKQVNDNAGHAAGDAVLRQVAAVLHDAVRSDDAAARLGGDEFALLLPGCVAPAALQLADKLRLALSQLGIDHGGRWLRVGASIGVVEISPGAAGSVADWLARADAACYAAKHAGRGTVRLAASQAADSAAVTGGCVPALTAS